MKRKRKKKEKKEEDAFGSEYEEPYQYHKPPKFRRIATIYAKKLWM